ncbi:restriction endonuclease subunit S, partial [Patescibacteria group bacterium]|nr:restriction endonuclease subunit S [Patescibacteria group bacterium]
VGKEALNSILIGTTQKALTIKNLKSLEISLPPLSEQKRISSILSSFDNKIEQLKKENNILEDIAQTIFKEWFIKYNFPDKDGKPYKDNGGKMVESELGLIPEGWRVGKLGEITEIIMGQSPKGESYNTAGDGIPLLNGALELTRENILNNKFTTQPTKISKVGDILFCIRATIGNIHFSDKGYCLGRGVASLRTTEDMQYYIYFLLHNIINTISISAEGSVIKGLTKDIIYNYPNIYNKETANLYNAHIKPLIISTQNNDKMINILDKCKSNLIKTLIK